MMGDIRCLVVYGGRGLSVGGLVRGKALWLRDFCPGFQFEMFFLVELGIVAGVFSREGGVGCLVAR